MYNNNIIYIYYLIFVCMYVCMHVCIYLYYIFNIINLSVCTKNFLLYIYKGHTTIMCVCVYIYEEFL